MKFNLLMILLSVTVLSSCLEENIKKQKMYQAKSRQAAGKLMGSVVYTQMMMDQLDFGKFDVASLDKIDKNPDSKYQVQKPDSELSKKYCPDCSVNKDTFKILIAGNIDEDDALDLWSIDQEKNLVNIQNDAEVTQ